MLWKKTKEFVVSGNSCSKNFVNFQEKHPPPNCFFEQSCRLLDTYWECSSGKLRNFQNRFPRKYPQMPASAISSPWKMFQPKGFFKKISHWFDIQWHVLSGIKCVTEVWRLFTMFVLVCTWFVWFTSLRDFFI